MEYNIAPYQCDATIEANMPPVIRKSPPTVQAAIEPDRIGERLALWLFFTYLGWKPYLGGEYVWLDFRDLDGRIQPLIFKRSLLKSEFAALITRLEKLIWKCTNARGEREAVRRAGQLQLGK